MTDKQFDELLEIFQKRMQAVTDEYLQRMGQQLKEIGELIPSAETRLIQMKKLDMNLKYIQSSIARASEKSIEDIAAIFEAIAEDNARFAEAYFGAKIGKEVLYSAVLAQFKATAGEMKNLSRTTIDSEPYRTAVDKGIQAAHAGVEDYKSAIRRAMKEAAESGLRMRGKSPAVEYPNGRTKRLDSAARQNVLDGIRKLNQANMEMLGKEFGSDGIELSAHMMCAEDHLPYQGKQFSNEEFAAIQAELPRPFGEWNCRHSWSPIIMGISQPAYSDEELKEFAENSNEKITIDGKTKTRYQWTQEQRKIETAIRYQQDIATAAKASGDDVLKRESRRNISDLNKYYEKIVEAANVPARPERMGTYYGKNTNLLKENSRGGIIPIKERKTAKAGGGVRTICRLDRNIYSCISKDISTDEVVLIDERILHIQDHHPNDFERYGRYIKEIIENPDYIIEANREKDKSGLLLKEFVENEEQFQLILRLATSTDRNGLKNSVITFQYIKKKEYARLIRNKKILYKKDRL